MARSTHSSSAKEAAPETQPSQDTAQEPQPSQHECTHAEATKDQSADDHASGDDVPFQQFQTILGFLASIGLALTGSVAFALLTAGTLFGDSSPASLAQLKRSALLLSWSAACFVVAIAFIVAPQLLYTELVIVEIIKERRIRGWDRRLVRVAVGVFAWIPLGFQTAAMYLFSQSLEVFGQGPVALARYGITGAMVLVATVTLIGVMSDVRGRKKLLGFLSFGLLTVCTNCGRVISTRSEV